MTDVKEITFIGCPCVEAGDVDLVSHSRTIYTIISQYTQQENLCYIAVSQAVAMLFGVLLSNGPKDGATDFKHLIDIIVDSYNQMRPDTPILLDLEYKEPTLQ